MDNRLIRFAAFNIQIFGDAKIGDNFVREKLIEIFTKFDLIVVQEIRDSNGDAFPYFIQQLNKVCDRYDYSVGERQGQRIKLLNLNRNLKRSIDIKRAVRASMESK